MSINSFITVQLQSLSLQKTVIYFKIRHVGGGGRGVGKLLATLYAIMMNLFFTETFCNVLTFLHLTFPQARLVLNSFLIFDL